MARRCQISGKRSGWGNSVSHSHRATRRRFQVNLTHKDLYLPDENRYVRLRVSARMLRSLNKRGVKALMRKYGQDLRQLSQRKPAPARREQYAESAKG